MTKQDFADLCEIGWDFAIDEVKYYVQHPDIQRLCIIYRMGYDTTEYRELADPDYGLCFAIRQFAISKIYEILEEAI